MEIYIFYLLCRKSESMLFLREKAAYYSILRCNGKEARKGICVYKYF